MFIELLKDKSLKNILLKADLDNETKELETENWPPKLETGIGKRNRNWEREARD